MKPNSIGSTHSVHSADFSDEASGPNSWHPEVPEMTYQDRVNPWFQALPLSPPRAHNREPSKKPERRLAFSLSTNEAASSSKPSKSSVNKEMKIEDRARRSAQRQFEMHQGAPIPDETRKAFKEGHYSSDNLSNKERKKEGSLVLQFYDDFARDARSGEYVHKKFKPDKNVLAGRIYEPERPEKDKDEDPGHKFWRA